MPNLPLPYKNLIDQLQLLPRQALTLLIGIDGCGGSGKTTFSKTLQTLAPAITIVQMDDFFLPTAERLPRNIAAQQIGADFDWCRLRSQVLEPLHNNIPGYYQRYEWKIDSMVEWHTVPVGGIVIIEGIYSIRKELAAFYDFKIWFDCPRDLRLARALKRDGEAARPIWETDWMPAEDLYVKTHEPFSYADLIVDGSNGEIFA
jgi:uridine kinase